VAGPAVMRVGILAPFPSRPDGLQRELHYLGGELFAAVTSSAMNQTLLIVEDDESTAEYLADNLLADGYRVAVASGAAEGVRQIEVRHPALVLLDLGLDDGSGLILLDRVRSADGMTSRIDPDLPVIVISGRGSESDRIRSFARGADDHVPKPLAYGELLGRIRAVLRRAEDARSVASSATTG